MLIARTVLSMAMSWFYLFGIGFYLLRGTGDFVVQGFSWLELHLITTGQCYSVDVSGGSRDLVCEGDESWKKDIHPGR